VSHDLAELVEHPEHAMDLAQPEAVRLLAQIAALQAVLQARVLAAQPNGQPVLERPDRLLDVDELAAKLNLSAKQIYRRANRWPFTRRPSEGTLRFSERALEQWMAGKSR
jgi:predicted DNA-binding transcriptional regulator AlpA